MIWRHQVQFCCVKISILAKLVFIFMLRFDVMSWGHKVAGHGQLVLGLS